jgi:hypothetical protein
LDPRCCVLFDECDVIPEVQSFIVKSKRVAVAIVAAEMETVIKQLNLSRDSEALSMP